MWCVFVVNIDDVIVVSMWSSLVDGFVWVWCFKIVIKGWDFM